MAITGFNNVTLENVTNLANSTTTPEFLVKINSVVYDGTLFFILLVLTWFLMIIIANKFQDQLLNNVMYSSAIAAILSFILRAICFNNVCLLSDYFLWVFPILTAVMALIVWISNK